MGATVFQSHSVLGFSTFLSLGKRRSVGKPIFFVKDVTSSPFHSRKDLAISVSSIRSEGNGRDRPSRRSSSSGKTTKNNNENKIPQTSSDGKKSNSANQEEIIALFRKIQFSIAKERSISSKSEDSDSSSDAVGAGSILKVFRESGKQEKGKAATNRRGNKPLRSRSRTTKDRKSRDNLHEVEFKLSRPPSKFVKRSPIPFPSPPRVNVVEVNNEESKGAFGNEELKFPRIEEMKVAELKEVAKSRGIRGYSKLKKSELLELLRS